MRVVGRLKILDRAQFVMNAITVPATAPLRRRLSDIVGGLGSPASWRLDEVDAFVRTRLAIGPFAGLAGRDDIGGPNVHARAAIDRRRAGGFRDFERGK